MGRRVVPGKWGKGGVVNLTCVVVFTAVYTHKTSPSCLWKGRALWNNVVGQQFKPPVATLASDFGVLVQVWLFRFLSSFLLPHLRRLQMLFQVLGLLTSLKRPGSWL